jgi:hypothetical protein
MPTAPVVVRRKKAPVIVVKKKETQVKPAPAKEKKGTAAVKQPAKQEKVKEKTGTKPQKPDKPKGPAPVDKAQQHAQYLSEIDVMSCPGKEIARACYFLCFLFNENPTTTES